ncbi:MAG: type II toxin-antitoxin system prevent-host-death family antitoxin [Clostridiales Family XIII bacterium]|nr:type II toxin-antitoxin system prevent-host-death family antitoxin [Clostridiales Family XIII bacterium]
MIITATELKNNVGKYLLAAEKEDVIVTKRGRSVALITLPKKDKSASIKSLFGILPSNVALEEARDGRLSRYENLD